MRNFKHNISQEEYDQFVDLLKKHTKDEVAKILGVSRRTVYNYIDDLGIVVDPVKTTSLTLSQKLAKIKK